MPALGERFRAAREARGLSLSDVAEQIRIRSVYLAAIEDEKWSTIGVPVYVRGFLRTYARFLGLDPEDVVAAFNSEPQPAAEARPAASEEAPKRVGAPVVRGSLVVWVAAAVAVLLIAFVVFNELTMRQEAGGGTPLALASASPTAFPSIAASATMAAAAPSASPLPGGSSTNSLALVLSAASWLRVTIDGTTSMEGTFPAGTSKTFYGKKALLRIGNAGGVDVYVDGKDVGKLGKPGDVVERTFTL